jgi:coenzyme F420-0:L-glutamate ligase / coenzyme F420-1:gamma-L-glutamate ligase
MTDSIRQMSQHEALLQALHERRSLRRYQAVPVPHDIIEVVLEAGLWAPSAHNRQPWRFVVLTTFDAKDGLARAMGARLRRDLEADHVPEAIISKDVTRSYERLTLAPVVIVVCLTLADMDTYPDEKRSRNEYVMAVQGVAMAGQNMLLAAHGYGLGACWMCAPLFCPDVVRAALALPDDWQPQGAITMGYPAQQRSKTREPLQTRVLWR